MHLPDPRRDQSFREEKKPRAPERGEIERGKGMARGASVASKPPDSSPGGVGQQRLNNGVQLTSKTTRRKTKAGKTGEGDRQEPGHIGASRTEGRRVKLRGGRAEGGSGTPIKEKAPHHQGGGLLKSEGHTRKQAQTRKERPDK